MLQGEFWILAGLILLNMVFRSNMVFLDADLGMGEMGLLWMDWQVPEQD